MLAYSKTFTRRFSHLLALIKRQLATYCPKLMLEQAKANTKQQERAEKNKKDYDALLALACGGTVAAKKDRNKSSKRLKIPYHLLAFLMQKAYFSSKGQH